MSFNTPLSHLTDSELINQLHGSADPTWMEIELAERLERLRDSVDDLIAAANGEFCSKPEDDDIFGVAV